MSYELHIVHSRSEECDVLVVLVQSKQHVMVETKHIVGRASTRESLGKRFRERIQRVLEHRGMSFQYMLEWNQEGMRVVDSIHGLRDALAIAQYGAQFVASLHLFIRRGTNCSLHAFISTVGV